MKRSGKFYRKNEAEVMRLLGLEPTKNSGSGWVEKEDGQNEYLICQLKSTDAQSIKINLKDLHVLEYNANVSHKLPLFAIQFLQTNEVYLLIKPINFDEIQAVLNGEAYNNISVNEFMGIDYGHSDVTAIIHQPKISSNEKARNKYMDSWQKQFKKKERNAK